MRDVVKHLHGDGRRSLTPHAWSRNRNTVCDTNIEFFNEYRSSQRKKWYSVTASVDSISNEGGKNIASWPQISLPYRKNGILSAIIPMLPSSFTLLSQCVDLAGFKQVDWIEPIDEKLLLSFRIRSHIAVNIENGKFSKRSYLKFQRRVETTDWPGLGFNGAQILRNCCRFYAAALDQYRFKAIFGSLDMSQNQIANHLRAIESQPRTGDWQGNVRPSHHFYLSCHSLKLVRHHRDLWEPPHAQA